MSAISSIWFNNVCIPDESYPMAMLAKELIEGTLDSRKKWIYHESPAYEFESAGTEQFDKPFEPMRKEFRLSQKKFYIYSFYVIQNT